VVNDEKRRKNENDNEDEDEDDFLGRKDEGEG